jgi:hypothetical protein
MNKLTLEQEKRLNDLEIILKLFLKDIDNLRENGENDLNDVNSLFDELYDCVKERIN